MRHVNATFQRIQWEARRRMRRLSLHTVTLATLSIFTAIAATGTLMAMRQASELRAQLIEQSAPSTPNQQTERRPSTLPPYTQRAAQLKQIYDAAQETGVRFVVAEYQTTTERDNRLVTVRISATTKDEYVRIQAALLAILRALPNAGIESATFRRETRASNRVQARLNLVLYYTPDAWGATQ